MKKTLLIVFLFVVTTAFAVDMKGKIGLGTGTTRFGDILKPSLFAMRFGISEKMLIEPWFDISSVSGKITIPKDVTGGEEAEEKLSLQNKGLGLQTFYVLRGNEKSNLYGIGGFLFGMAELKSETKYGDDKYTATTPLTYFAIPLGIGGERFLIDDCLSVNINAKCGFAKIWGKAKTIDNATEKTWAEYDVPMFNFGNSLFSLYFMWYF